jgi:hypothetical protein
VFEYKLNPKDLQIIMSDFNLKATSEKPCPFGLRKSNNFNSQKPQTANPVDPKISPKLQLEPDPLEEAKIEPDTTNESVLAKKLLFTDEDGEFLTNSDSKYSAEILTDKK